MSANRKVRRRVECCLCGGIIPLSQAYDLSLDPADVSFERAARFYDNSTGELVFGPIEIYGYMCEECAGKLDYVLQNWSDLSFKESELSDE